MRKLEELAEQLGVGLRASGEIYSPHPRNYYWRCWLGDEFTSVSLSSDPRHPLVHGIGMDMLGSMNDLVTNIKERTLFVRRVGAKEPERFEVEKDLIT